MAVPAVRPAAGAAAPAVGEAARAAEAAVWADLAASRHSDRPLAAIRISADLTVGISGGRAGPGGGSLQGAARFGLLNDAQPIRSADFNLDYRVTPAEYERKARETFTRLDANHDGVLRVSELPPPPSLAAPRQGGGRQRGAPGGGRGGGRGGRGGGGMGGPSGGF